MYVNLFDLTAFSHSSNVASVFSSKALNIMKKNSEIPLLAKISQQDKDDFYHVDYRAGKIYQSQNYKEQDLKRAPLIF